MKTGKPSTENQILTEEEILITKKVEPSPRGDIVAAKLRELEIGLQIKCLRKLLIMGNRKCQLDGLYLKNFAMDQKLKS